jgi:outer membrane biosynthesis protein TonB
MAMLKNYKNELIAIAVSFSLISYTICVLAAEPVKTKPIAVKAKKEVAKPTKEVKPAEPVKKDPNRKKPTLKKKYADKK